MADRIVARWLVDFSSASFSLASAAAFSAFSFHFRATSKLAKKDEPTARSLSTLAIELSDWIEATYPSTAPAVPDEQNLIGSDMAGFRRGEPGSDLRAESSSPLAQVMSDMRSRGQGFAELARLLDVRAQDVRDLMLGVVTFAIQRDGVVRSRSRADLRDASLAPVADLNARRGWS